MKTAGEGILFVIIFCILCGLIHWIACWDLGSPTYKDASPREKKQFYEWQIKEEQKRQENEVWGE